MLMVALACGGGEEEAAAPAPAATQAPAPAATTPPPTSAPAEAAAATAAPDAADTAAAPAATSTPVPEAAVDFREDWVSYLTSHPGYQSQWGTPQYGGTIKLTGPATPSLTQVRMGWSAFINLSFHAHNSLLAFDPWLEISDGLMCDLCESFEISADGKEYTFKLRDGVMFHSEGYGLDKGAPGFGDELVCEDAKASMEWFANPHEATRASYKAAGRTYMGHMTEATCPDGPDGKTLVLKFDKFRNPTTGWMASGMPIWDKDYREWMDAEYPGIQSTAKEEGYLLNMGTGPLISTAYDPDTVLKAKKNPNYFIKGAPFIDGVEFYPILDYNTKFAAFITGKVDHAGHGSSGLTKAQVVQIQKKYPNHTAHIVEYNHISQIPMNPFRAPFDLHKVRYAVHLAMDRQAWLAFNVAGTAEMASHNYYLHKASPWSVPKDEFLTFPGWNPATKDADIAEANRLLDEVFGAGVRPTDTEMTIWTLLSRREIGVWALDQFKNALGWELAGRFVEVGEWGKKRSEGTFVLQPDAAPMHGMGYIADPSDGFFGSHSKTGNRPDAYIRAWKGQDTGGDLQAELDRVDKLIEEQDVMTNDAERLKAVHYLSKYMINERTTGVFLGSMNVAWGLGPRVRGGYWYSLGTYSQQRLYDRWWLVD